MKHHILVIDDELAICDFLDHYLTQHGFKVTSTTNASDALRLLDQNRFHFVVLDIVLKECDGLELLSEIKAAHPRLPVLMLTGLGFQEDPLQQAKRRGAVGYLSKSLMTSNLLLEIRRQLTPPPKRRAPAAAQAA
jgi:DNA-binding NtrC family response regulator